MSRWSPLLLALVLSPHVTATPVWSWETAWTARQMWSLQGTQAGVAAWSSTSGWTEPGLWAALGAGIDAGVTSSGTFRAVWPQGLFRMGVQAWKTDSVLVVPWLGGATGWSISDTTSSWGAWEAGLDAEVRLWGAQYAVIGLGARPDGALGITLGFRERSTWVLPRAAEESRPVGPVVEVEAPPAPPAPAASGTGEPQPVEPRASQPLVGQRILSGPFSPDGDGVGDNLDLALEVDSSIRISSWSWTVFDPLGHAIFRRAGLRTLPTRISWDGLSSGEPVFSATEYTLVLGVDALDGRRYESRTKLVTDLVLLKDRNRYRIRFPQGEFLPDTASRLNQVLQRFPKSSVTIVDYSNSVSGSGAQAIKDALVALGLAEKRIVVMGAGGSRPLYPPNDTVNSWKNRRIEVVLEPGPGGR